jgi:hypothetical protein
VLVLLLFFFLHEQRHEGGDEAAALVERGEDVAGMIASQQREDLLGRRPAARWR